MDQAVIGSCRIGYFRIGVLRDDWDRLLNRFKSVAGCDVTRRRLQLGTQDSTTGWYSRFWESTTIESLFVTRGASHIATQMGTYVRLEALMRTADPVEIGDEIVHANGDYYEVKDVRPQYLGESFWFRECDLSLLPFHDLSFSSSAPTVEDAKYRTKVYWDTYINPSNLRSQFHDGRFIVCYDEPPYPFSRMFLEKGLDMIFAVSQPVSTALMQGDQTAYGYEEQVPTHVITLDSELQWLGEHELRRIVEVYPEGSLRTLTQTRPLTKILGTPILYDTEFTMAYNRDLT